MKNLYQLNYKKHWYNADEILKRLLECSEQKSHFNIQSVLLTFSLIILFSSNCFTQEVEELPEIPWRAIAEVQDKKNTPRWTGEVTIKLFGNYSKQDSMLFLKAVHKLNRLTETIDIKMSSYDRGQIEFYFLDSLNAKKYSHIVWLPKEESTWYIHYSGIERDRLFTNAINITKVPENLKENYYTNRLAFSLYSTYWFDHKYYQNYSEAEREKDKYKSIFRSIDIKKRNKLFYEDLHAFDKKLLTAVYSSDFEEKIKIAKKQFGPIIPWWLKVKPFQTLIIPFGIISLLLLWVLIIISKKLNKKIKNKLLHFNSIGTVGLLFIGSLFNFYFFFATMAKQYNTIGFHKYFWPNMVAGIILTLIIGLPAINLLRIIEKLIHKNTYNRSFRVLLIFLSTALIPSSAVFAFFYFDSHRKLDGGSVGVMISIFLALFIVAAFRALISYFFFKEKDLIVENETKLSNLRELKTKAELNALHSRINPHFLYNSLNSIAGLAHNDADKTEHMALSLSKLFRYSINKEKSDWTTFNEELEMVKIYLDVEKVRFDDRLTFSVEIPKELEEYKIPRFIIQPLVENAVKHGISKSVEGGEIKVGITKEGKSITIAVSDSGQAFPDDLTPGFGIQSIYDKLEILYKDKFEMKFINSPKKQVTIKLK